MAHEELPPHIPPPPPDPVGQGTTPPPVPQPTPTSPTPTPSPISAQPTAPQVQQGGKSWMTYWIVVGVIALVTRSLYVGVIAAIVGLRFMRKAKGAPPSPKNGLYVALGGVVFAFLPLIEVALFPNGEYEGTDYRPLLMIFTIPIGFIIVLVGIIIRVRATRRPHSPPSNFQGFTQR